jgi:hypothetical protein
MWRDDKINSKFSPKVDVVCGDSIFRGLNNKKKTDTSILSDIRVVTPKNNAVTESQKLKSQKVTSLRLSIGNLFCLMKKNKILVDKWKRDHKTHHMVWTYLGMVHNRNISEGLTLRSQDFMFKNKNKKKSTTYFGNFSFNK